MASNRLAQGAEAAAGAGAEGAAQAADAKGGGLGSWLPLIVTLIAMPALAYATTTYLLLPKIREAVGQSAQGEAAAGANSGTGGNESGAASGSGPKSQAGVKIKQTVPISKIIVNVAGTMGTRYLMTSISLVGATPDFKNVIDANKDQLLDLANGTLSGKTISDLERPGARNQIRTELMTVFNNALGGSVVQEIYITELAIQ